jgi:uncharacterized protein (DUF362 family)
MSKISRREFLRLLAASAGAAAAGQVLSGCGPEEAATQLPAPTEKPVLPTNTSKPADTSVPVATTQPGATETQPPSEPTSTTAASPTPSAPPDLVVARGGEPEDLVRQALKALGGMEQFVKPGNVVVVKPNICIASRTYEFAATTNPWVVGTLVKMCLEAGASKVMVMDTPYSGTAEAAYKKSGIQEQVEAAGGEMAFMPGFKYVETELPEGKSINKTKINDDVLKADVLINVPIAKTHGEAGLTLSLKNLMGVIQSRQEIHWDLSQRIADLHTRIKPNLTVLDAVRVLTQGGPGGGSLSWVKKMDTVIAGTDMVAIDTYAANLFFNKQPGDIVYIARAAEMGLGNGDISSLRIQEVQVGG